LEDLQDKNLKNLPNENEVLVALPMTNKIVVDFGYGPGEAVFDSGASVSVIKEDCLPEKIISKTSEGVKVVVRTATGERTPVYMVELPCSIYQNGMKNKSEPVKINCIVMKNLVWPRCLVSLDAYRCLVTASRPKTDEPKYKIRSENGRTEMSSSSENGKLEIKNVGEI